MGRIYDINSIEGFRSTAYELVNSLYEMQYLSEHIIDELYDYLPGLEPFDGDLMICLYSIAEETRIAEPYIVELANKTRDCANKYEEIHLAMNPTSLSDFDTENQKQ